MQTVWLQKSKMQQYKGKNAHFNKKKTFGCTGPFFNLSVTVP